MSSGFGFIAPERADELYEKYFDLGPERTIERLSRLVVETEDELQDAADLYGWRDKAAKRDHEIDVAIEKQFRAGFKRTRDRLLQSVNQLAESAIATNGLPSMIITSPRDLREVAAAFRELCSAQAALEQAWSFLQSGDVENRGTALEALHDSGIISEADREGMDEVSQRGKK